MKRYAWVLAGLACLGLLEGICRYYGLHEPVLYEPTSYGYRVLPNQNLLRIRNRVFYNEQGLRSEPIRAVPAKDILRILCVGDSITNGGTPTDQSLTYPYLLGDILRVEHKNVEVLNASAGGWAPENEAGWLRANGIYGSKIVILEIATHDLFQPKAGSEIVGKNPSFPAQKPFLGLEELVFRYVLPRLGVTQAEDPGVTLHSRSEADVKRALATLDQMANFVRVQGARVFILFIEQPRNIEPADALTAYAKDALFAFLERKQIPLIRPAARLESNGGERLFRDGLHPNAEGNKVIAKALAASILSGE